MNIFYDYYGVNMTTIQVFWQLDKNSNSDFISLVQDKIEIEKYIAATLNGERGFQQKWKFFLTN